MSSISWIKTPFWLRPIFLLSKKEDLAQKLNIDIAGIEQLLLAPRNLSFDGLLQWFQLAYICPFDAGKDLLSVDCIVSHTVLEHIPEHVLRKIFRDTRSLCGQAAFIRTG
jgi:hypothetical protein